MASEPESAVAVADGSAVAAIEAPRRQSGLVPTLALVAAVALLPFAIPVNIATEIVIFGLFAMSTNLLIGTAGLYSFGQAAFFGVGGYAAGYLAARGLAPLPVMLLAAALAAGLLALVIGAFSIRRTGIYFMMLTFAFNQLVYYISYSWHSVTGGEDGLAGIKRMPLDLPVIGQLSFDNHLAFYWLSACIFLAGMVALRRVVDSPLGMVLTAARLNPRRTASLGYPVHTAQLIAFVMAGAIAGIAGALFGMLYRIMPIDSVHWVASAYVVFMVLIGGTRSMLGPVIGAAIFIWLQGLFSLVWARWPLLLGLFVIVVMLFLPGGVLDLVEKARHWVTRLRSRS
ncbi:branched-chain amino acid ABC transporter permease [Phreatobacter stygius]|uniref:Branched-chain amino acid ABC transporter permease n=1 Tax=Phreatobacter stygius TaxID=1940610 RepID=A0A4D7B0N9_9HYPH|nr:branched-chain amino acid ABC transporter permease [Phreatobacter stygius]QCI66301.1 branched-chain amino acid ABC transporter permease [Phreatobacter stygius]